MLWKFIGICFGWYLGWSNRTQFEETWATLLGVLVTQPITMDQEEETQQEVTTFILLMCETSQNVKSLMQKLLLCLLKAWWETIHYFWDFFFLGFLPTLMFCLSFLSPGGSWAYPAECAGSTGHHQPGAECHDPAHCWQPCSQLSRTAAP